MLVDSQVGEPDVCVVGLAISGVAPLLREKPGDLGKVDLCVDVGLVPDEPAPAALYVLTERILKVVRPTAVHLKRLRQRVHRQRCLQAHLPHQLQVQLQVHCHRLRHLCHTVRKPYLRSPGR